MPVMREPRRLSRLSPSLCGACRRVGIAIGWLLFELLHSSSGMLRSSCAKCLHWFQRTQVQRLSAEVRDSVQPEGSLHIWEYQGI